MEQFAAGISLLLTAVFVFASVAKIISFRRFTYTLKELFPMLRGRPAVLIGLGLLVALGELAIGLCLVTQRNPFAIVAAVLAVLTLIAFTFVIRRSIKREIPCGCFGSRSEPAKKADLRRNLALVSLASLLTGIWFVSPPSINYLSIWSTLVALGGGFLVLLISGTIFATSQQPVPENSDSQTLHRRSFLRLAGGTLGGLTLYSAAAGVPVKALTNGWRRSPGGALKELSARRTSILAAKAQLDPAVAQMTRHFHSLGLDLEWNQPVGRLVQLYGETDSVFETELVAIPSSSKNINMFWVPPMEERDAMTIGFFPDERRIASATAASVKVDVSSDEPWKTIFPTMLDDDPTGGGHLSEERNILDVPSCQACVYRCRDCENDCKNCRNEAHLSCAFFFVAGVACCAGTVLVCLICGGAAIAACAWVQTEYCDNRCNCFEECDCPSYCYEPA